MVISGIIRPALHASWVGDATFLPFQAIPRSHSSENLAAWFESAGLVASDLEQLLSEPCHVFWSHLIFDDSLRANLDSFLKIAPRDFDGLFHDDRLLAEIQKLYRIYFKVFIRMTTCKESADNFITPSVFGTILYDNYILDLPKILDLCAIFGSSNEKILTKMIENVFTHQPNYLGDVAAAVPELVKVFEDLIDRLTDNKLTEPRGLTTPNPETSTADVDILDLCLYASDMSRSIYSFLHIYPPACAPFNDTSIYKTLCSFYTDVLDRLLEQLGSALLSESDEKLAYKRLQFAQEDSVSLFRHILFTSTLGKTLTQSEPKDDLIQEYYDILTEYLGETRFMGHYSSKFPFQGDLELISQLNLISDNTRQSFISEGFLAAASLRDQQEAKERSAKTRQQQKSVQLEKEQEAAAAVVPEMSPPSSRPDSSNVPSSVQSVLNLFPHLGVGFIEMCLKHCNSVENVINALLEENLPEFLSKLDRNLLVALEEETLVSSRRNVFDNDEFDVFRNRTIDTSKVHRGKRGITLDDNDDSYKEKIKDLVLASERLALEEANEGMFKAAGIASEEFMYDDEYDDTYDANEVGADDADEALELMGRKMVVPLALGGSGVIEEDEDPNTDINQATGNRAPNGRPRYDVQGRAKGQGQTAEVIKNRNFKTAHKARGANHNRKAGARSKMSKGMF